MEEENNNVFFP